jgi:hypothetical protein
MLQNVGFVNGNMVVNTNNNKTLKDYVATYYYSNFYPHNIECIMNPGHKLHSQNVNCFVKS